MRRYGALRQAVRHLHACLAAELVTRAPFPKSGDTIARTCSSRRKKSTMSDFKFRFPAVAITAFVALTAVATIPVAAQTPATSTLRLSLDDVVRLALTNGTQPALARSSQVRATTSAAEARAALLPEA